MTEPHWGQLVCSISTAKPWCLPLKKPFTQPFQSVSRTISYNRKVFHHVVNAFFRHWYGHDAISLLVTSTASKQEVSGSSPKMWVWRNRSRKQLSQCKYLLGWIKHCAALDQVQQAQVSCGMLTATDLDVTTFNKTGGLEECQSLLGKHSYWPKCGFLPVLQSQNSII